MAISINWATKVISVPQADLTPVSGALYELNINDFRGWLNDIQDSEAGIVFPTTHRHNTEVTVGGTTLARTVEILAPYTVTFEDGQYAVRCVSANHNLADVVNINQVSLRTSNSAGLISVGGSSAEIASATVAALKVETFDGVAFDDVVKDIMAYCSGKMVKLATKSFAYKDRSGSVTRFTLTANESERNRT